MNGTFKPSEYQLAIFDELRSGEGNLIVEAVAGSGKTTTIVEGLKVLPDRVAGGFLPPAVTFLAFNKSIAETLSQRCPRHVQCSTFHSLGFRALKSVLGPRVKVEGRKVIKLVWDRCDRDDPDIQSIAKLVSLARSLPMPPDMFTSTTWHSLISRFDIDIEDDASLHVAQDVLEAAVRDHDTIDFDDMLYMPVILGAHFAPQDFVFVDEAQDTNDIQLEIIAQLTRASAASMGPPRLCAVGDPHQAIYGFRGANSDSMSRIATRFACKTLPLSVSYRCPKAVVREAQKYLRKDNAE